MCELKYRVLVFTREDSGPYWDYHRNLMPWLYGLAYLILDPGPCGSGHVPHMVSRGCSWISMQNTPSTYDNGCRDLRMRAVVVLPFSGL